MVSTRTGGALFPLGGNGIFALIFRAIMRQAAKAVRGGKLQRGKAILTPRKPPPTLRKTPPHGRETKTPFTPRPFNTLQHTAKAPHIKSLNLFEWAALWAAIEASPAAWIETTEDMYWHMLECVPPRAMNGGRFLVGEASHSNGDGESVYASFMQHEGRYFAKYETLKQFKGQA